MLGCNCCIAGATPTPDISDSCVCNAGKGAVFVGSTGSVYIRIFISNPCLVTDWWSMETVMADINAEYPAAGACVSPNRLLGNDSLSYDWGDIKPYAAFDEVSSANQAGGANGGVGVLTQHVFKQLSIINPDPCKSMSVLVVGSYGVVLNGMTASSNIQISTDLQQDAVAVANPSIAETSIDASTRQSFSLPLVAAITILPGATSLIQLNGRTTMTSGGFTSSIWYPQLAYVGVTT